MTIDSALVGKAGEYLVAAELMRRDVYVSIPASDKGIDLIAYKLAEGHKTATKSVQIQVKTSSGPGYAFKRKWFDGTPDMILIQVWNVVTVPHFYVFCGLDEVVAAIGEHAKTPSWIDRGIWTATVPSVADIARLAPYQNENKWNRIIEQLS